MKTKVVKRIFMGVPIGISIGYVLSIVFSTIFANGYYGAVHPELTILLGSEINAVMIQAILWGIIGAVFAGGSVIWELDHWSLTKQTITVFSLYFITMTPIALFLKWIPLSTTGFIIYITNFFLMFSAIWLSVFFTLKRTVDAINDKLSKNND